MSDSDLRITEIFFSIQGESTRAGLPCAFVRLNGCNLRCTWCDTPYSFSGGEGMQVERVLERIRAFPTKLVEITGGEPLLQSSSSVLAQRLLDEGYTVLCETSGERDIDLMPAGVHRIMDLKPPSSGEVEQNRWDNIAKLREGDELKFVLADRADFDWMLDVLDRHQIPDLVCILASPVQGQLDSTTLAEWILKEAPSVRLNLQLHKLLWGDTPGR